MPVLITPKPRSTPNPDGSTSPNPQDRIAQLEAELSSAESEIGKLTEGNRELQAQKESLQEAHEKELHWRNVNSAQYDAKINALKKQHSGFVSETKRCDRRSWVLRTCLVAALLVTALGFGLLSYWYWPEKIASPKKSGPAKETTTYHVEMNPSTFEQFFPDYIGPTRYCGRNISVLGKINEVRVLTPTIDCTEKGLPTSDAKGCKDVTQCSILIKGAYPEGPYDVVDTRRKTCIFSNDECTIRTLRTRTAEKE